MFRLGSNTGKFARYRDWLICFNLVLLAACYRSGYPQRSRSAQSATQRDHQQPSSSGSKKTYLELAVGGSHSCAIRGDKRVFCWGANDRGQLGDGTRNSHHQPRAVKGLPAVVQLALGKSHSCARTESGKVWCWGEGIRGQLGDNRGDGVRVHYSMRPVAVQAPTKAIDITAGDEHVCMRSSKKEVYCWGDNRYGQIGSSQRILYPRAIEVRGTGPIEMVAAGSHHSCALRKDGVALCWGANDQGQLGDNRDSTHHARPGRISSNLPKERVYDIVANGHQTCILSRSGIRCWGNRQIGQTGRARQVRQASGLNHRRPILLHASAGAQQLAVGSRIVCAAQGRPSKVNCWGSADELPTLPPTVLTQPQRVAGLSGTQVLVAGLHHQCAIRRDQSIWCWGKDIHNSLGQAKTSNAKLPTLSLVSNVEDAVKVVGGDAFSCALKRSGMVACWGKNDQGQLAHAPTMRFRNTPIDIPGLTNVVDLAATDGHACAVTRTGKVYCWGANSHGQIDSSKSKKTKPLQIPGVNQAQKVATGQQHTCILDRKRSVWCWGNNQFGQLGQSSVGHSSSVGKSSVGTAREVPEVRGTVQLVAGDFHNCVIRSDSSVWCWGDNRLGQLGSATGAAQLQIPVSRPIRIAGSGTARLLSAGSAHTCAQMNHGKLHCWGSNRNGQMGNGTLADSWITPVPVPNLASVQAISSFGDTNCAIRPGRSQLWCWGHLNFTDDPQASNAVSLWRTPRTLHVLDTDQLALGRHHGCARLHSGRVACWGASSQGERGAGEGQYVAVPVEVARFPR